MNYVERRAVSANAKILILKLITTYEMVSVVLCRFIYTLSAYFNEYIHVL